MMKRKMNETVNKVKASILAAALALSMAAGGSALLTVRAEECVNVETECQYGAEGGGAESETESETGEENGEESATGISDGNGGEINPCGEPGIEGKTEN